MNEEQKNTNEPVQQPGMASSVNQVYLSGDQRIEQVSEPVQPKKEKQIDNDQVIGQLKGDTQKSPLLILIMFAALIACVYFIPEITPYFKNVLAMFNVSTNDEIYGTSTKKTTTTTTTDEEEVVQEDKIYELSTNPTIVIGTLSFNNFKVVGDSLTYTVTNTGALSYDLNKNKAYIDLYDTNNTYLRSVLVEEVTLKSLEEKTISTTIDSSNASKVTKIEVLARSESDYPEVTLKENMLTCTLEEEEIVYSFDDSNKLTGLTDSTVVENATVEEMTSTQQEINTLNDITGVSATFTQTSLTGYTTIVSIPYEKVTDTLDNENYYAKDVSAKRIKFEMMAKGYTCS